MKRKRVPKAIVQQPGAQSYARFLASIKERIRTAQVKAALAAKAELGSELTIESPVVVRNWEIGRSS